MEMVSPLAIDFERDVFLLTVHRDTKVLDMGSTTLSQAAHH